MNKFSYIFLLLSIIWAKASSQDNFNHLNFKLGLGSAGVSVSGYADYSAGVSFLAGLSKNYPIGSKGVWFINGEANFNYASVVLNNDNIIENYNLLLPIGIKYSKNQKSSFCLGLVPTYSFASRRGNYGDFFYNLPDFETNSQGVLNKSKFITSPFTVQFRLGVDFKLNESTLLGAEFMKYLGGRTYFNKTYNSYESFDLNYGTIILCITKRIP
jgi:hypothetical protein